MTNADPQADNIQCLFLGHIQAMTSCDVTPSDVT